MSQKAMHEDLMERFVPQENATAAWLAVIRNRGAPGIDGMTTQQLRDLVRQHWKTIRSKVGVTKFFDRVNHDILMASIGKTIRDNRVLKLIGRAKAPAHPRIDTGAKS